MKRQNCEGIVDKSCVNSEVIIYGNANFNAAISWERIVADEYLPQEQIKVPDGECLDLTRPCGLHQQCVPPGSSSDVPLPLSVVLVIPIIHVN